MSSSKAARIWRRTWFGALLASATVGIVTWAHGPHGVAIALGCGSLLALMSLFELERMGRVDGTRLSMRGASLTLFALLLAVVQVLRPEVLAGVLPGELLGAPAGTPMRVLELLGVCLVAGLVTAPLALLVSGKPRSIVLGALWVAFPMAALSLVREGHGGEGLMALLLLSKIGDIAGYYVGNAIGRTHPFPRLSPGKTTEGCLGSLLAGVALGHLCQSLGWLGEPTLGPMSGLLFGGAINLASQAGDLLESCAKRAAGVKDSSGAFGPSGGTLDVVDSLLLSVPVGLAVWPLLFQAGSSPGV